MDVFPDSLALLLVVKRLYFYPQTVNNSKGKKVEKKRRLIARDRFRLPVKIAGGIFQLWKSKVMKGCERKCELSKYGTNPVTNTVYRLKFKR